MCGVLIALGVNAFAWSNGKLPKLNKASWKMLPIALLSFAAIGAMGAWQPEILGNGKAGNQLSFADALTWQTALALLGTNGRRCCSLRWRGRMAGGLRRR